MVKIMENPMKMDDLGGKPPIFGNTHIGVKKSIYQVPAGHPSSYPPTSFRKHQKTRSFLASRAERRFRGLSNCIHHSCQLLGCPRKLGSMVRINGLFHPLINGIFLGVKSPTDRNLLVTSNGTSK